MHSRNVIRNVLVIIGLLLARVGAEALGQTPVWTQRSSTGPSARHSHGLAYDSARGRVVLFGGASGSTLRGDTWEWDGTSWAEKTFDPNAPKPSARHSLAMAYDSARRVVVLFGGNASAREADTWEWDGTAWDPRGAMGGPSSRWGHVMAYDAGRGVVVLFGGYDNQGARLNDTWEWDGGTWIQRTDLPAWRPSARAYAAMAYDGQRGVMVLFGGHQDGSQPFCGDTWEYDGTEWTQRATSGPSAREGAALAYDATGPNDPNNPTGGRECVVLFGGYDGSYKHDTWRWNGATYTWIHESDSGPSGRYSHTLAYCGKVLLFGGLVSGNENRETWDYGVNLAPQWACCFADGSCQNMAEAHCLGAGGVSWREGETCSSCQCAAPPPEATYFLGDQPLSGSAAHQVNTATGNFHYSEVDLSVTSRREPLVFGRHYNSLDRRSGPLGPGWRHTYHIVLTPPSPPNRPNVSVTWADGQAMFWEPDPNNPGGYKPATRDLHDQIALSGGEWTVTCTNLDRYRFDSGGRLLNILPKNNSDNAIALTYDPVQTERVTRAANLAGQWLDFGYDETGLLTSVTDYTSRSVTFAYSGGRLTQVTDVLGHHINYEYDADDYLKKVKDQRQPQVTVITNTYAPDHSGRVFHYMDGNSNTTDFLYRAGETEITQTLSGRQIHRLHKSEMVYQRQTTDQDSLEHQVVYTYDENFNRQTVQDRNGNVTKFMYDSIGNVTSVTDPNDPNDPHDGGVTTFEYNDPNVPHLPTRKTDALGYVTDWTYDAHGNMLTETRYLDAPPGASFVQKSWIYNSFDRPWWLTDERGNKHEWVYDATGKLAEERQWDYSDPNSPVIVSRTWYGYDDLWRRIWVADGRGTGPEDPAYTTHYTYDNADRLIEIQGPPVGDPPHSIVQTFGYDEVGNRTSVVDGNGNETTYDYDGNNNNRFVHQPLGRTTQYQYDELNRRVKTVDAFGHATDYTYDDADRLVEARDAMNNAWAYTHDAHGNVLTQTDPSAVVMTYVYDVLHRRTETRDGLSLPNTWHTEYDQLGRVTQTIDATNQPTQFTYDGLGRLTDVLDAAGGHTQYTYDPAGNLLQILDANGHAISKRQYDALNRLIRAEDGNGNHYTYGYDAVGNQTWVRDANAQPDGPVTTLTYDAVNRRMAMDYPDGSWVTFAYDNNGNRERMTESADPNAPSLFGYDALNQLLTSKDRYGIRVDYGYDPVGNRTRLVYPGSQELTYGYDAANRLTSISDWAARTTHYTYNGLRVATVTYPNNVVETHGYDAAGRLTSLVTTLGEATVLSFGWARDGEGEPLTATETNTLSLSVPMRAVSYEYDSDNRLVESSRGTYEHDANGNLTCRTIDGVTTDFEYDAEDRLITQVRDPNGPTPSIVEHVYDGDGNRIARTDFSGTTRYVLDRSRSMSHVLCESDGNNNIIAYYIHGPTLVARIDAAMGSPSYYHCNDLGNVVALTHINGNVVDRYAYEPYGLPAGHEGTTPSPFTFVGGLGVMVEADSLYFMRARFYDPDTGRFLGKDPVEGVLTNPGGLNRYVYGLANPEMNIDPTGEVVHLLFLPVAAWLGIFSQELQDFNEMRQGQREWGHWSPWERYVGSAVGAMVELATLGAPEWVPSSPVGFEEVRDRVEAELSKPHKPGGGPAPTPPNVYQVQQTTAPIQYWQQQSIDWINQASRVNIPIVKSGASNSGPVQQPNKSSGGGTGAGGKAGGKAGGSSKGGKPVNHAVAVINSIRARVGLPPLFSRR